MLSLDNLAKFHFWNAIPSVPLALKDATLDGLPTPKFSKISTPSFVFFRLPLPVAREGPANPSRRRVIVRTTGLVDVPQGTATQESVLVICCKPLLCGVHPGGLLIWHHCGAPRTQVVDRKAVCKRPIAMNLVRC